LGAIDRNTASHVTNAGDITMTCRCAAPIPRGHHVQLYVTFLNLEVKRGPAVRRLQCTAIDDATRMRALEVHARHR